MKSEATVEWIHMGMPLIPSEERELIPVTVGIRFPVGYYEIKGYLDKNHGKETYTEPLSESGLDTLLKNGLKEGDKLLTDIYRMEPIKFKVIERR